MFRLDAIRAGVVAIATVVAGALLLAAPVALAAGADSWTPWTPMPQDTWIRSLDFTAASTLLAGSDGDGIFQAAATLGPWAQTNDGLTNPEDLKAFQVVASGGKLYAATSGGLFTAPQGGGTWSQLGAGPGNNTLDMGGIQSVVVSSPSTIVVAVAGAATRASTQPRMAAPRGSARRECRQVRTSSTSRPAPPAR